MNSLDQLLFDLHLDAVNCEYPRGDKAKQNYDSYRAGVDAMEHACKRFRQWVASQEFGSAYRVSLGGSN